MEDRLTHEQLHQHPFLQVAVPDGYVTGRTVHEILEIKDRSISEAKEKAEQEANISFKRKINFHHRAALAGTKS